MELENLDKVHANMWHWVRRNMTYGMLEALTNKKEIALEHLSDLEVDRLLREAFEQYQLTTSLDHVSERSKVRSGILHANLGNAILEYSEAIKTQTLELTCKSIFGDRQSKEHAQKLENKVTEAFVKLCSEISKVR